MNYYPHVKRVLDICIALLMVTLLFPLMMITSLVLLITIGNPFFFQKRPGKDEKEIMIIKFKTMKESRDQYGNLLPDMQRITKFGKLLRSYSIDELPQLFNVLKGDMSLVGPRPLLFKYIPLYNSEQRRRHKVCPGITGWAQINGRNSITWNQKFEYDIYYIDNISFLLDIKILFLTLLKVIKGVGVNQSAERPMQPFNGNN